MPSDVLAASGTLFLGSRIKRLADRMQADAAMVLEGLGLPVQPSHVPLLAALDRDGTLTVSEAVEALGISQPAVTRIAGFLADIELIEVSRSASDGRQKCLVLTASGDALVARIKTGLWPQVRAAADALCDGLSGTLLEQLTGLEERLEERALAARIADAAAVRAARGAADLAAAARLFEEYAAGLDVDLSVQNFAAEIAALPGAYAPPSGALLLAIDAGGEPVGCVGLRAFGTDGACELKRLYVRESMRGSGLGRRLLEEATAVATASGYREMVLDSLSTSETAVAMYRRSGFAETEPYWHNPLPGVVYFRKTLVGAPSSSARGHALRPTG